MKHLDEMIAWENGELDENGTIKLFAALIRSGDVWALQGCYGRTANRLICAGLITPTGEIVEIAE